MKVIRAQWIKLLRYLLGITFSKSDIYIIGDIDRPISAYVWARIKSTSDTVGLLHDVHIANFTTLPPEIPKLDNTYCNLPTGHKGILSQVEEFKGVWEERKPITGDQIREVMNNLNRP